EDVALASRKLLMAFELAHQLPRFRPVAKVAGLDEPADQHQHRPGEGAQLSIRAVPHRRAGAVPVVPGALDAAHGRFTDPRIPGDRGGEEESLDPRVRRHRHLDVVRRALTPSVLALLVPGPADLPGPVLACP